MTTAAEVQLEILGKESLFKMTEDEFLEAFFQDPIVQMYLMKENGIPKHLATKFALEVLHQRYFHRESLLLPRHERKKLKISQIWSIHNFRSDQVEALDPFTDEGRLSATLFWKFPK